MTNSDPHALSPGQLAWRRLKRNKLAMTGLGLVILFHVLCFGAPLYTDQDPSRNRAWLGSLPPGSETIDCLEENYFEVGKQPSINEQGIEAERINIQALEQHIETYRIIAYTRGSRKGTIKSIQRKSDTQRVNELDLNNLNASILDAPDTSIAGLILRKGGPAPEILFKGQQVAQIQVVDPSKSIALAIEIDVKEGLITSIRKNNKANDKLRVYGEHIETLTVDGSSPTNYHLLGTDHAGRDLFTRILYGGRISLLVGIVATIVSLVIGVLYGAISGFQGGRTDRIMMSSVDILYALPFMFIVILLLVSFGKNILILFAALGAVQWLTTARIVRGQVLTLKGREFIEAAKVNGASTWCIITRHLLPNSIGPIIIYATLTIPAVILEESFLAFLGLQVEWGEQQLDSWGALVNAGRTTMNYQNWDHWWQLVWPSMAMILTLFGLNTLGDGLRDALDPQDAGHD